MAVILVVDDDDHLRELNRIVLECHGCEVLVAANGQDALHIFGLEADRIAVVLLDLTMPVMGGEETLRRLRAIRPDIPVVLTSGDSYPGEAICRLTENEFTTFLQKPSGPGKLVETVEDLLARAHPVMSFASRGAR